MFNEEDLPPAIAKDCNDNTFADGDSVHLTQDLKTKGSSGTLRRGTVTKGIRLTKKPDGIERRIGKGIAVLKMPFVKKT